MDAVTLGLAKADIDRKIGSAAGALLMAKLSLAIENVVVYHAGDSTGVVGTDPWPKQVTAWLAAKFPAYTVNYRLWSDGSQSYTTTVVQTGTGAFTLDVYNGSVSGSSFNYPMLTIARWGLMWPVATPTLIFINYGHNSNLSTNYYRYQHYSLCRTFQESFPEAGIIQIAQNPRATSDAERANDLYRARQVMTLSATEGYGLVDVTRRFLSDPDYETTLTQVDGLHPNDAGSSAWATEVEAHLSDSRRISPMQPMNRETRLWVPATAFTLYSGSPTLALQNSSAQMWTLPPDVDSAIVATVDLPSFWGSYDLYLLWTTAAGSGYTAGVNANVRWRTATQVQGLGVTTTQFDNSSYLVTGYSNQQITPTNGAAHDYGAYATFVVLVAPDATRAGRPLGVRVTRVGTDVEDVMPNDALFRGALFVRGR